MNTMGLNSGILASRKLFMHKPATIEYSPDRFFGKAITITDTLARTSLSVLRISLLDALIVA